MSTNAGPSCPKPFNHLKFFAGPVIAGCLILANSFVFSRSPDNNAKWVISLLCVLFLFASVGIHVGCLQSYIKRNSGYAYRPTETSIFVVVAIQLLMFIAFAIPAWHFFKLHLHK